MRVRVLIVDDDPVQRRLLDDVVRKFGYEPIMAASGNAAMAALAGAESARTDAVVLDLVMPDPDGLGTLAKMRAAGLATPVIVQSSRGGGDDLVTAMRAEATDFVIKPVDAERLRVLLRNALSARAPAAELARSTQPSLGHAVLPRYHRQAPARGGGGAARRHARRRPIGAGRRQR